MMPRLSRSIYENGGAFLEAARLIRKLQTYHIGRKIELVPTIDSTQDEILRRAEQGEPEGFVLVAGCQTAGRGRQGDRWFSPAGTGLYVSVLLRPDFRTVALIPLALGLSAAQAVEAVSAHIVELKWPNDLILKGRKLGGVIAESQVREGRIQHIAAGIGINVQEPEGGWPPEIAMRAACIGCNTPREDLISELLNAIETNYTHLRRGRAMAILDQYRSRCLQRSGKPVRISHDDGRSVEAIAVDVEDDGSLLVEHADGRRERIYGQPVTLALHGRAGDSPRERTKCCNGYPSDQ